MNSKGRKYIRVKNMRDLDELHFIGSDPIEIGSSNPTENPTRIVDSTQLRNIKEIENSRDSNHELKQEGENGDFYATFSKMKHVEKESSPFRIKGKNVENMGLDFGSGAD